MSEKSKIWQPRMYRQGDILLVEVLNIPREAKPSDDMVLAVGEVTGHSHKIQGQLKVLRIPKWGRPTWDQELVYLDGSGVLIHEEHKQIEIPFGKYQVRRQREYIPGTTRLVMD